MILLIGFPHWRICQLMEKKTDPNRCPIPNFIEQAVWLLLNDSYRSKDFNIDLIIEVQLVSSHAVTVTFLAVKRTRDFIHYFVVRVVIIISSWGPYAHSLNCQKSKLRSYPIPTGFSSPNLHFTDIPFGTMIT